MCHVIRRKSYRVITCPGCNEFYIGEIGNTLRARVSASPIAKCPGGESKRTGHLASEDGVRVQKQHINTTEYRQTALSEHF